MMCAMQSEHCFILVDVRCIGRGGAPRLHETGRSQPMSPAAAHAAAKRDLVAQRELEGVERNAIEDWARQFGQELNGSAQSSLVDGPDGISACRRLTATL